MSKLIIIPDVHGRSFWRDAVADYPGEEFIFLGDYLDPYPDEDIPAGQAFKGLRDILTLKEIMPDRVTLLWGNHDLHYLYPGLEGSRLDEKHSGRNWALFNGYRNSFQIAAERTVAGRRYLFTHAGVGKEWAARLESSPGEEELTAELLNSSLPDPGFIELLSDVSVLRGGYGLFGSCIWADVAEHAFKGNRFPSLIQVFGHSMVSRALNIDNRIFCLDCRKCFYLDLEKGGIYTLEGGTPIPVIAPEALRES